MPAKIRDFKKNVIGKIRKNFKVEEVKSHHIYYEVYYGGKRILKFYFSHSGSNEDIGDAILSKIKRDLRLDNSGQLRDLINCPMSESDYFNLLKEKNII